MKEEKDLIYLYCVTRKAPKLKDVDKVVDKLYFIYHCGLYAIVSKVSSEEFAKENLEKNLNDMDWVKKKANIHEQVIEGIMKSRCVLPFKFATLYNSEVSLKLSIENHVQAFRENLEVLEGKQEWGVKIYCDIERLKETLISRDQEILNINEEINNSSSGKGYLLKKKKEDLINQLLNKKYSSCTKACFEELNRHCVKSRINRLLPKEVTERKEEMILNSAFLIEENTAIDFIAVADSLKTAYKQEGFLIDCTGPWPAYNFCQTQTNADKKNADKRG
ncbi:MAG: GvpL/GvpF family gas vesicle protein [Candidatus Omnitrophota bacterium]|nr:GvpL/GvpF family gas vesicle protein [Candidatus Omnitrophota bacterium]